MEDEPIEKDLLNEEQKDILERLRTMEPGPERNELKKRAYSLLYGGGAHTKLAKLGEAFPGEHQRLNFAIQGTITGRFPADVENESNPPASKDIRGWACGPKIYKYGQWVFEMSGTSGPWPHNKDGELRKKAGAKFYRDIKPFLELSHTERKQYRIGGGCQEL